MTIMTDRVILHHLRWSELEESSSFPFQVANDESALSQQEAKHEAQISMGLK